MSTQLKLEVELSSIDCGCCGGTYAINERYRAHAQKNGLSWTCPYCRTGWGFAGNGDLQKAEKALAEEKQRHQNTLARLNAAHGEVEAVSRENDKLNRAITRHKKRAAAGTCPCCQRTFKQLAAHMKAKHPEYGA